MSYTTGVINGYLDLVNNLRAIGEAVGWITHGYGDGGWLCSTADGNTHYTLAQASMAYSDIWNTNNRGAALIISQFQTLVANAPLFQQGGQDTQQGPTCIFKTGPTLPFGKFYAFATGQYIHMAIEVSAGTFAFVMIGQIDKDGAAYTGGGYNSASMYTQPTSSPPGNPNTLDNGLSQGATYPFSSSSSSINRNLIRVDGIDNIPGLNYSRFAPGPRNIGNFEGISLGPWAQTGQASGTNYNDHPMLGLIISSASTLGNNTMLIPCSIFYIGAQNRYRYLGSIPDHAVCDMSFCAPGDIIVYGGDEWMVFPPYRKGLLVNSSTLNAGVAFKLRR